MEDKIIETITNSGVEGLGRFYSVYIGIVVNHEDPLRMNRVKVWVPNVRNIRLWALPKNQMGGINYGVKGLTPHNGEVVWVTFEQGDISKPVWEYHGWAENEAPLVLQDPDTMGIVTPYGSQVLLNDGEGKCDVYINGQTNVVSEDDICIHSIQGVINVNGGQNGGMVNVEALTEKLNQLVQEIENLKTAFNTHTHSGVQAGTGSTAVPVALHNDTFSTFNKDDFEDTNFIH